MKTDRNYKMTKLTKIMLLNIEDKHYRGVVARLFAEAENHSVVSRRKMSIKVVDTDEE